MSARDFKFFEKIKFWQYIMPLFHPLRLITKGEDTFYCQKIRFFRGAEPRPAVRGIDMTSKKLLYLHPKKMRAGPHGPHFRNFFIIHSRKKNVRLK